MPAELKELMRHASIETTMTYYVGQNAEATAQGHRKALGHMDEFANADTRTAHKKAPEKQGLPQ